MTDKIDISGRVPAPVISEEGVTELGTIATAVVHTLSQTVVFGVVPTSKLAMGQEAR
jgi:hypothetical protein